MTVSVMSDKGVAFRWVGSGEVEGFGVGRGGLNSGTSGTTDTLLLRDARTTLLRFVGEVLFVGEAGSSTSSCGVSTCDVSADSSTLIFRLRVLFGVEFASVAFLRLGFLGLFVGAGVNSSSSSRVSCRAWFCSLSESSTIVTLRRPAAALRDGRELVSDMALCVVLWIRW
jgi:hypothetical protein